MTTWIALFRGINVGGKNSLPMTALVRELESHQFKNIQTYIQSGNAVFQSQRKPTATLTRRIAANIEKNHGFQPDVLILGADQLRTAMEENPFPEAVLEPKTLHFLFLASAPVAPDLASLDEAKTDNERYHLAKNVFYLHAPDGIGRSKLAAKAERILGVRGTGRNWRTVQKLAEMAGIS